MGKLNQWLTLVTNIGVLIGVAFLVVEFQQNTSELRLSARQSLTQENTEFARMFIENPEVGKLFTKVLGAGDTAYSTKFSSDERDQIGLILYIAFAVQENQFNAWQDGVLTDAEWEPTDFLLELYANSETVREYWRNAGYLYRGKAFTSYFESKIPLEEANSE